MNVCRRNTFRGNKMALTLRKNLADTTPANAAHLLARVVLLPKLYCAALRELLLAIDDSLLGGL